MDLQMITPVAVDWDGDGDVDLISGDEDGRVAWIEHTGRVTDGLPQFAPPRYFRQEAREVKFGALVTPFSFDWDGDGDEDLICGNTAGYLGLIENLDGGNPPKWAAPRLLEAGGKVFRIQAGPNGSIQGPAEAPPKPAWTWWNPQGQELATQWRTTPFAADLNKDGLCDLVMLDHEGYLALYQRQREGEQLVLLPPQRIFTDAEGKPLRLNDGWAGKSGRRKFCLADWDRDGKVDLLLNSVNVNFWRNVSTEDCPWAFADQGPVHERALAGHTTSPTVADWDRDGAPDLLIGGEDGRIYWLRK
jgi:hypothetical protein